MTGPTHIAFSVAAALGLVAFTGVQPTALGWLAVVFGALAPDLDTSSSTIGRPGTMLKRFLPKFLVEVLNECGAIISWIVRRFCAHRGASHWPVVAVGLIWFGFSAQQLWLVWFGWSYAMHILADFCTYGGVPLFGPFWRKPVAWSPLRTGSTLESIAQFHLWLLICYWSYPLLPSRARLWFSRYVEFFQTAISAVVG